MTKITSIDGPKDKEPMCPYCGLVPASKHPDYTCPRLASASWGSDGGAVEFISPERWELFKDKVK